SGASQTVASGLQFMRSYATTPAVTNDPPQVRTAYLDSASSSCGPATTQSYFSAATGSCTALLHVTLDLGSVIDPSPPNKETRIAANTEVRYKIVRDDGTTYCDFKTTTCDLTGSGGP